MHWGCFRMQLCLHHWSLHFWQQVPILSLQVWLKFWLARSVLSANQKFLALQIWTHLLELHLEKRKSTFTLQVWLHVVPLRSKWYVSAYIALRYSSSYMSKLPRAIFKVFKAKCLLSSLPGRCNRFPRELSRAKKFMPWLRETIPKVIFFGQNLSECLKYKN